MSTGRMLATVPIVESVMGVMPKRHFAEGQSPNDRAPPQSAACHRFDNVVLKQATRVIPRYRGMLLALARDLRCLQKSSPVCGSIMARHARRRNSTRRLFLIAVSAKQFELHPIIRVVNREVSWS